MQGMKIASHAVQRIHANGVINPLFFTAVEAVCIPVHSATHDTTPPHRGCRIRAADIMRGKAGGGATLLFGTGA